MIVAHVLANLIAFVALLECANRTIEWFGVRAGVELTLEVRLTVNVPSEYFFNWLTYIKLTNKLLAYVLYQFVYVVTTTYFRNLPVGCSRPFAFLMGVEWEDCDDVMYTYSIRYLITRVVRRKV